MDLLAGAGDTWGIPGTTFLAIFAVAAVGAMVVATLLRRTLGPSKPVPRDLHPYEAAYLTGGRKRALAAALAVLRADHAIESAGGGRVRVSDGPPPRTVRTPLDDGMYEAIRQSGEVRVAELADHPAVRQALDTMVAFLERDGLARTQGERAQVRMASLPIWLVTGIGVVRVAEGLSNQKPVGFLIAAIVVVALLGLLFLIAPLASPAGHRALKAAQQRNAHLNPHHAPAWATYGATGAAFGVALFGTTAMMSFDPAFAQEAELNRYLGGGASGGDGGSSGGGCGGGSGCGGGGGGCGG